MVMADPPSPVPPTPDTPILTSGDPLYTSNTFAADYRDHSDYLRETLPQRLRDSSLGVSDRRVPSERAHFDSLTASASLSIQAARMQRRGDQLYDELVSTQTKLANVKEQSVEDQVRFERSLNKKETEVQQLNARVIDLELRLNAALGDRHAIASEFSKRKAEFGRAIALCKRNARTAVESAERGLVEYSDGWSRKLQDERAQWVDAVRKREEASEINLMSLQNQWGESQAFYDDHIKKLRGDVRKEEEKRRNVEIELEEVSAELSREKAARKAVVNQLKKERMWREKMTELNKNMSELRAQSPAGNSESERPVPANKLNPADTTQSAYIKAMDELIRIESSHAQPQQQQQHHLLSPQPQQQVGAMYDPTVRALEEERRRTKILALELMKVKALGNLQGQQQPLSPMPPFPPESPSPYFPLGGSGSGIGNVKDGEVQALRLAVERADIENVLEREIGLERDVELDRVKAELEDNRLLKEQYDKKVKEAEDRVVKERESWVEKEKLRSEAIGDILKSAESMREALEEEKARHKLEADELKLQLERAKEDGRDAAERERRRVEDQLAEQAMALKEARKIIAGDMNTVPVDTPEVQGRKKIAGKRASMHSVPDVGDWTQKYPTTK